jgi:hypothetical protein
MITGTWKPKDSSLVFQDTVVKYDVVLLRTIEDMLNTYCNTMEKNGRITEITVTIKQEFASKPITLNQKIPYLEPPQSVLNDPSKK